MGSILVPVPIAAADRKLAASTVTLAARPSRPSVKFAPFTVPIIMKNRSGIFSQPKSSSTPGIKGTFAARLISVTFSR